MTEGEGESILGQICVTHHMNGHLQQSCLIAFTNNDTSHFQIVLIFGLMIMIHQIAHSESGEILDDLASFKDSLFGGESIEIV